MLEVALHFLRLFDIMVASEGLLNVILLFLWGDCVLGTLVDCWLVLNFMDFD